MLERTLLAGRMRARTALYHPKEADMSVSLRERSWEHPLYDIDISWLFSR